MAKSSATAVKLSEHFKGDKFAGYKRTIGGEQTYFGQAYGVHSPADKHNAERAAAAIENEWRRVRSTGATAWTPAQLDNARRIAQAYAMGRDPMQPAPVAPVASPFGTTAQGAIPAASLTLHTAVKLFIAEKDTEVETNEITDDHCEALKGRLTAVLAAQDANGPIAPDIDVTAYNRDAVKRIVDHFKRRPKGVRTGKAIGVQHVISIVGTVGQFFRWLYGTERWDGFRGWENSFKFDPNSLRTPVEMRLDRKGKPKYTVAELATLYSNAPGRTRLYMLLALNAGMGAKEQATLQIADCQLDASTPHIERYRNKTGVLGKWNLWPETVTYLRMAINRYAANDTAKAMTQALATAEANSVQGKSLEMLRKTATALDKPSTAFKVADIAFKIPLAELAILTEDGYPLVHRAGVKKRRTSAVNAAWSRLAKMPAVKGNCNNYGFYPLRRTAGQMVRNLSTLETAKVFFAHRSLDASGRLSVAEKHYTERSDTDFDRVSQATEAMYQALAPMFDTARVKDAAPKEKRKNNYPATRKARVLVNSYKRPRSL